MYETDANTESASYKNTAFSEKHFDEKDGRPKD